MWASSGSLPPSLAIDLSSRLNRSRSLPPSVVAGGSSLLSRPLQLPQKVKDAPSPSRVSLASKVSSSVSPSIHRAAREGGRDGGRARAMEAAAFEHGAFVFRILRSSHPISANTAERMERANQPGIEMGMTEGGMHGTMAHGREGERGIFESRIYLVAGYTHTDRVGRVGIGLREF